MYLKAKNMTYKERMQLYYEQQLSKIVNDPDFNENQREVLGKYEDIVKNRVTSVSSVCEVIRALRRFALFLKKDLNMVTYDDMMGYLKHLRAKGRKDNYLVTVMAHLKCFYKWYLGNDEEYPKFIRGIKIKTKPKVIKIEELLTEEDIVKMLKACGGSDGNAVMKRALFMVIVDSGGRIAEILGVKIKDVIVDEYGYILAVNGKTGYRRIRLTKSVPYLKEWLNIHQSTDETPLFVNFLINKTNGMAYERVFYLLKGLKKIAGINKPVNPHALRHRRATEMSNQGFNDKEMNIHFGWTQNSNMARHYNHNTENEVSNKVLANEGITVKDIKKEDNLKLKVCPRCGNDKILPHNDYCSCGLMLVDRKPDSEQTKKDKVENILQGLVNDKDLSKEFNSIIQKFIEKSN